MATAQFLEGVSGGLANRWVTTLFTPAFVFWFGGALAAGQRYGWPDIFAQVQTLEDPLPLGLGILALLAVGASGFVVQQFDFTVLRLLEGYWPRWCYPLARWLVQRQKQRFLALDKQVQAFYAQPDSAQRFAHIQHLAQLQAFPPDTGQRQKETGRLLPTRLGNLLRAAEDRCGEKYGLDAIICWPRLWLVLPDGVKTELAEARNQVNLMARLWLWSGLFILWAPTFRLWWPLGIGLASAWLTHRWLRQAAQVYGDLVESAFDLYRFRLYETLRWPQPTNPAKEKALGQQLTAYLWQGSDQVFPTFSHPDQGS